MLKRILNLEGAQQLNKREQKAIFGGAQAHPPCDNDAQCDLWTSGAQPCCNENNGRCTSNLFHCD